MTCPQRMKHVAERGNFPPKSRSQLPMAAPTSPPLPWPSDAPFWKKAIAFLKTSPISALLIYTVVSLCAEENYPLSNYPMYSNPSPERPYYLIADGEGKPLPIQTLTGITCPKIGKIYRTKAEKLAKQLDIRAVDLKPENMQSIGMEMFAQFRHEAEKLKQPMPAQLQLVKTYITYENGKVVETPNTIAQEPAPSTKVP